MTDAPVPVSTYRLQLQPDFTLDQATDVVDYLADLGVTHAYLSPILTPTPGSKHGYDVVDHTRVNPEIGGDAALDALLTRLREAGMGAIVDIVPNHMAVPTPLWHNAVLWSLLREGRTGPTATWFDVDWDFGGDRILMPVLGGSLAEALDAGEITYAEDGGPDRDERVLRYYDKEFPVREGTQSLALPAMVDAQHYRLANWREATTDLNYRRFFDVTELIAIRVEEQSVFDASHALVAGLVRDGRVDGIRVDHPDGLADPAGYLEDLAAATDGAWVVVEKILEGEEQLPTSWATAGTTGYDALMRVGGLFVDADAEEPLTALWRELTGESEDLDDVVRGAKRRIVERVQVPEVERLVRIAAQVAPDADADGVRHVLQALLVAMDRYRIYLEPGEAWTPDLPALEQVDDLVAEVRETLDGADRPALELVRDLIAGRLLAADDESDVRHPQALGEPDQAAAREFLVRFQQTCGPVMAKGIEDTAFYRYHRLDALNEVGGDPDRIGVSPSEFHDFAARLHDAWPTTMTTLSTHDTKRSEDVRARLAVLSEQPGEWAEWIRETWSLATAHRGERLDAVTEYFLWQTLLGAWPIPRERLHAYAEKAIREDKRFTVWTDKDEDYEAAVHGFVDGVLGDDVLVDRIEAWLARAEPSIRANTLGQKLIQLVMTGVPDVYQGTEVVDLSLVDPDNRRLVDYDSRRVRLARLDGGAGPDDLDDEKLLVTSRALRLRRDHPDWFVGSDSTIGAPRTTDPALVAVARGSAGDGVRVVALATRLVSRHTATAGEETRVDLPAGRWIDLLTGADVDVDTDGLSLHADSGPLSDLPVALLVRADG